MHVSKVRSLALDKWESETIEVDAQGMHGSNTLSKRWWELDNASTR